MVLPIPGIQDISSGWNYVYDKFQLLVPVEYHVDWFYFMTPPPMEENMQKGKRQSWKKGQKTARRQGCSRMNIGLR